MVDEDFGGIAELLAFELVAVRLEAAEMFEGLVELAGEALAVESEGGERAMCVDHVEPKGGPVGGAREQLGFEVWNSIEAPGGVGEFVNELGFGGRGGLVLVEKLLDVAREGGRVLGREDGGASGEAVAQGVKRRSLFAGVGARAGGALGICSVGGGAVGGFAAFEPALDGIGCGRHVVNLGHGDSTARDVGGAAVGAGCWRGVGKSGGRAVTDGFRERVSPWRNPTPFRGLLRIARHTTEAVDITPHWRRDQGKRRRS